METYITKGIVLKEINTGESNKLLTVFTEADGRIILSARGARKPGSKNFAGAQTFCFSEMNIFKGNGFNRLNNASPIESFYELRTDLDMLETASEIALLTLSVIQENQQDTETLRLILNTYYMMSKGIVPPGLCGAIYKMRLLCLQGFYPEEETLRRMIRTGDEALDEDVMKAALHICEAEDERLFSFGVSERAEKKLSEVCDALVKTYLDFDSRIGK